MVDKYFSEYAAYHNDRRNLVCHEIGIPLIVWALFALLELVIALFAIAALYSAGRHTPWPLALGAFVAGWILQFVGHGYEGKKPAFLHNLVHLLVGPLWICSLAMPRVAKA